MKLATIEVIKNIRKHPNADTLEIANILEWQVVVKKETYQNNDKVVFIKTDTIVPRCQWSEFLIDQKDSQKPIRIKNIKLRGEYSSGLVIPLSEFSTLFTETAEVGKDLTSLLGVIKYIKELPANLSGENIENFPTHIISKTDEDNGLSVPDLAEQVFNHEPTITITQKLDGSSITLIVSNGKLEQVCSRNFSKKETENSIFWNAAKKLSLPDGWSGVIQGELCGNGIQKNPLRLEDTRIFVFQVKHNDRYMTYDEMCRFCMSTLKCDVVPLVAKIKVDSTVKLWINPLQKLQELADKQKYSSGLDGEGVVVRPSTYPRAKDTRRPLSFKLINRNYKD